MSPGQKIYSIRVETNKYQLLYKEADQYHFMNTDNYEQIGINSNIIDSSELLKDGEIVNISINSEDSMPLAVDMPASVILEITHTEPGIKGNTATNATKPAITETGAKINVPLFINEGDKIKIETEKGTYIERIKE